MSTKRSAPHAVSEAEAAAATIIRTVLSSFV
jgi:hypothetical protein